MGHTTDIDLSVGICIRALTVAMFHRDGIDPSG